jgi:uncharacterized protein YerC
VNKLKHRLAKTEASQALLIKDYSHVRTRSFLEQKIKSTKKQKEATQEKDNLFSAEQSIGQLQTLIKEIDDQVGSEDMEKLNVKKMLKRKNGYTMLMQHLELSVINSQISTIEAKLQLLIKNSEMN